MRGGFPDRLDRNLIPTRTHRAHRVSFRQRKRVSAITTLPPRCLLRRALITLLALPQKTTGSLSAHFRRQHTPQYVCVLIAYKPPRVNKESHAIALITYL